MMSEMRSCRPCGWPAGVAGVACVMACAPPCLSAHDTRCAWASCGRVGGVTWSQGGGLDGGGWLPMPMLTHRGGRGYGIRTHVLLKRGCVPAHHRLGSLHLRILSDGLYFQDAGAVFGIVPKLLWERLGISLNER